MAKQKNGQDDTMYGRQRALMESLGLGLPAAKPAAAQPKPSQPVQPKPTAQPIVPSKPQAIPKPKKPEPSRLESIAVDAPIVRLAKGVAKGIGYATVLPVLPKALDPISTTEREEWRGHWYTPRVLNREWQDGRWYARFGRRLAKTLEWMVETPVKIGALGAIGITALLAYQAGKIPDAELAAKLMSPPSSHIIYADGEKAVFFPNLGRKDVIRKPVDIRKLYAETPQAVDAIARAFCIVEDERFYDAVKADLAGDKEARSRVPKFYYRGIDYRGMVRAAKNDIKPLYHRLRGKKAVGLQGASTIPMQTAKIYTEGVTRSAGGKRRQMRNAMALWRMRTPAEIMELYLNRLPVYGSAEGIEYLSRLNYGKPANELDLLESIAIATTIRNPTMTTPFRRGGEKDDERRDKRRRELGERVRRALGRMKELGWLPGEEYGKKLAEFNQRYADPNRFFLKGSPELVRNLVMELVMKEMGNGGPAAEALRNNGITPDNVGTSGLEIHVTIDRAVQSAAEWAVRHNAGDISAKLEGFPTVTATEPDYVAEPRKYGFYQGRVSEIAVKTNRRGVIDEGNSYVEVAFADGSRLHGKIPYESLKRIAAFERKTRPADVRKYIETRFPVGSIVLTSVRSLSNGESEDGTSRPAVREAVLDIENPAPKVNSCVEAQRGDGGIVAHVGSPTNLGLDYCAPSERNQGMQPGSAFKSVLWDMALGFGWNIAGPEYRLPNNMRPFMVDINLNNTYKVHAPFNDHAEYEAVVNPYAAFAASENIAHFAMLYHMFDFMTPEQYQALAAKTPLARKKEEDDKAYFDRLAKSEAQGGFGIYYNRAAVPIAAFEIAVRERLQAARKKVREGQGNDLDGLLLLWYGHDKGAEETKRKIGLSKRLGSANELARGTAERDLRLVDFNYLAIDELNTEVRAAFDSARQAVPANAYIKGTTVLMMQKGWSAPAGAEPLTWEKLMEASTRSQRTPAELLHPSNIMLDGMISSESVSYIHDKIASYNIQDLRAHPEEHPMFRLRATLSLLREHAKKLGIESTKLPLEPTIILGAGNVVPQDFARAVRTMVTGRNCRPFTIEKIVHDGRTIYASRPACEKASEDVAHNATMLELMHGPPAHGTASYLSRGKPANAGITVTNGGKSYTVVPYMLGKTGTTSGYTDAWLLYAMPDVSSAKKDGGSVSSVDPNQMLYMAGWIGDYIKDGKRRSEMRGNGSKVYGADVAPIFATISREALQQNAEHLDLEGIAKNAGFIMVNDPSTVPSGYTKVPVYVYSSGGSLVREGECAIEGKHPVLACAAPDGKKRPLTALVIYARDSYGPAPMSIGPASQPAGSAVPSSQPYHPDSPSSPQKRFAIVPSSMPASAPANDEE